MILVKKKITDALSITDGQTNTKNNTLSITDGQTSTKNNTLAITNPQTSTKKKGTSIKPIKIKNNSKTKKNKTKYPANLDGVSSLFDDNAAMNAFHNYKTETKKKSGGYKKRKKRKTKKV